VVNAITSKSLDMEFIDLTRRFSHHLQNDNVSLQHTCRTRSSTDNMDVDMPQLDGIVITLANNVSDLPNPEAEEQSIAFNCNTAG
jgi:hypothetical protein